MSDPAPNKTRRDAMRKAYAGVLALGFAVCANEGRADPIPVPSGQPLEFLEFISEQDGALVRFRFLASQIGTGFDYRTVFPDFQVLCDEQVMPALAANGLEPTQIVLSMSAEPIPFGEDVPEVLQFFEIFRPENTHCVWEEF